MSEFLSANFQFLTVKFSRYLNRCVFVMIKNICTNEDTKENVIRMKHSFSETSKEGEIRNKS